MKTEYLDIKAIVMDTIPPTKNLHPTMIKADPISFSSRLIMLPINMHPIPKAVISIPAAKRGRYSVVGSAVDSFNSIQIETRISTQSNDLLSNSFIRV